jgi:uridine phosphorylase
MKISESELILNPDQSIYHLNLKPEELATTVITVGDQDRVEHVSNYFDTIEVRKQHREFKTHTGTLNGKRISVVSTGIGPDNIDIVLNELDALVNIDFDSRTVKPVKTVLEVIRIGTSGALQEFIDVDSFVASDIGIGFDNLLHFYGNTESIVNKAFSEAFVKHTQWNPGNSKPYVVNGDANLLKKFPDEAFLPGITTTNVGFYGPQGRVLRIPLYDPDLNEKIISFQYEGRKVTNLEMETAAIYGMSRLLGHSAVSLNVILANRAKGTFSKDPLAAIDKLIKKTLEILVP